MLLKMSFLLPHLFCIVEFEEAVIQRCSVQQMFLEISQNSQENTISRVSFLIKLRLWHRCFPVNFVKFLKEHLFS